MDDQNRERYTTEPLPSSRDTPSSHPPNAVHEAAVCPPKAAGVWRCGDGAHLEEAWEGVTLPQSAILQEG